jgi:hypothetical protein
MAMTKKLLRCAAVFCGLTALTACANENTTYAPPMGLSAQDGASILGTTSAPLNRLGDSMRTNVLTVDNQWINRGPDGWRIPVLVSPGIHSVTVTSCVHDFMGCGSMAFIAIAINFEPGKTYYIHSSPPQRQGLLQPAEITAWMEDANGQKVSPDETAALAQSTGAFVPIFIPAK